MDITEIGNRIKKRRTALEMTQKDLAAEMNVSNQLISKWETGESVPSLEYLDALCKVLKVNYSYFTDEEQNEEETPQSAQPTKPKKQSNFKCNWKLFIIIAVSVFSAAFIAGFTVLTIFVFVPVANKGNYIKEIERSGDAYFKRGYYSINVKAERDGDVNREYRYDGYFDDNGNPVFYDTNSKKIVKDGVVTYSNDDDTKYHYYPDPDKTYETVDELAIDRLNYDWGNDDEEEESDEDILNKISYIRKVSGGYCLEFKDEYFTDELSGTQKKNYKLTDKIKGRVEIKDGLFSSMKITVKYIDKPKNEPFTISTIIEFIAEKPVIEHSKLEERRWSNYVYVGDKSYYYDSPQVPDNPDEPDEPTPDEPETPTPPVVDTTPKCEDLLSSSAFVSRLTDGKAIRVTNLDKNISYDDIFTDVKLKDSGNDFYFLYDNEVKFLSKDDLSLKKTVKLSGTNIDNLYVYNGNIYYTSRDDFYYRTDMHVMNLSTLKDETPFNYDVDDIIYNGGYALYYGSPEDTNYTAYIVCDLKQNKEIYSIKTGGYVSDPMWIDGAGNVYCNRFIGGKYLPVIYKNVSGVSINDKYTVLKGEGFFELTDYYPVELYTEGDKICTYEGNTVYLYEYGELKETLTSSDSRFKLDRIKLNNGYCVLDTDKIYDENGENRKFEDFKIKEENGEYKTVTEYGSKKIVAVINGKLVVSTNPFEGYYAVYDENDLSKPLYCMKKPTYYYGNIMEIQHIGSKTFIAVIIPVQTEDSEIYGYELYCF